MQIGEGKICKNNAHSFVDDCHIIRSEGVAAHMKRESNLFLVLVGVAGVGEGSESSS